MNWIDERQLIAHPLLTVRAYGDPITLPAIISNGTLLDGSGQYIAVENASDACITAISRCYQHGLTLSLWAKFRRLRTGMYYVSTGDGLKVYTDRRITAVRHATGSLGHRVSGSFGSSFTSGSPGYRVIV